MANPFDELAAQVASLEERVTALEGWRATHTVGMTRRQDQINQVQRITQRDRFLSTLRRGRR
jgi:hypothetical protein